MPFSQPTFSSMSLIPLRFSLTILWKEGEEKKIFADFQLVRPVAMENMGHNATQCKPSYRPSEVENLDTYPFYPAKYHVLHTARVKKKNG